MKKIIVILLLLCLGNKLHAQDSTKLNKPRLYTALGTQATVLFGGMAWLNYVWYDGREKLGFHFYTTDAKGYLQIDKLGHGFGAYQESLIAYQSLRWAGVSKKTALLIGAPMGLILQTPIEVFDAMYDGYGFSTNDMIANFTGSAVFTLQEIFWNEQIIKPKFSFSPSPYRKYHPDRLGETAAQSFFLDYNAHTYWLSFPAQKVLFTQKVPKWLNFAVGYSANGMIGEFENATTYNGNPIPEFERYRQFLFSVDVDLTKIKSRYSGVRTLLDALNRIKIPAPTVEINRVDGVRFHGVYF
jgi:Predicted periplasmic lipoprotein (DUF2279)